MHKYLRAIGFSDVTKKKMEDILKDIIENPDRMTVTKNSEGQEFVEFLQLVSPQAGIAVRGYFDEEENFEMEYYVPYFLGKIPSTEETVEIEKHIEKESYAGLCDDPKIGLTLIFTINDTADLLAEYKGDIKNVKKKGVNLSALSTEARVILPIRQERVVKNFIDTEKRTRLMEEAAEGSQDAAEHLGMQDLNLISLLGKRVQKEDLLTIVSSYIMPYGIESDLYGILGDIEDVVEVENLVTEEHLYVLTVSCNGIRMEVGINKKDLVGIPSVGMRLRANIWMLGTLCRE